MTTCKWCGNGLPFVSWWTGKRLDYSRSSICTGEGGAGSHEPAATEGTPATPQTAEAVCAECGMRIESAGNVWWHLNPPSFDKLHPATPRTQPSVDKLHPAVRSYMEDEHTDLYGLTIEDCANTMARRVDILNNELATLRARSEAPAMPDVDELAYQREMLRFCGDNFTMQAGFQRCWLWLMNTEIASLRSQLVHAGMRISAMRSEIGLSPFSSGNEIKKIKKALADAERKGWNDAIEAAARKAESGQTPLGPKRIRALSREPGISRTSKGEEG